MQRFRLIIHDRVFAWFSIILIIMSWGIALWAWPEVPNRVPTHFGLSGVPDAWSDKSWWTIFLLPIVQVVLAVLLWWTYRHPQYSNIPSTMIIDAVPEPQRTKLYALIRRMLAATNLLVQLMLVQIVLAIISVAFGVTDRLNPWIMVFLLAVLLLMIVRYTITVRKVVGGVSTVQPPVLPPDDVSAKRLPGESMRRS